MLTARERARAIWNSMLMEGLVDGPLKGPQVIDIITTAIVIDRESFKLVDPTATGKGLGLIQERKVI